MTAEIRIVYMPLSEILRWPRNPKKHALDQLEGAIDRWGFTKPILIDERSRRLVAGHGRLDTLSIMKQKGEAPPLRIQIREDGEWLLPVLRGVEFRSDADAEAYLLADNRLSEIGGYDVDLLAKMVEEAAAAQNLDGTGFSVEDVEKMVADAAAGVKGGGAGGGAGGAEKAGDKVDQEVARASLAQRFIVPPFSVLDARQGYWQERKRGWLGLGIKSELGRGQHAAYKGQASLNPLMEKRQGDDDQDDGGISTGTSIFDPVLCEIAYRWFCPPGGRVLDPFAGGSVRGVVAAKLGRAYRGIDLRADQVQANVAQWEAIKKETGPVVIDGLSPGDPAPAPDPVWVAGDSLDVLPALPKGDDFDFLFTWPPYGNLEVYSDDPADLSTMEQGEFMRLYRRVIAGAAARLKDDRFAAIVVGDFRDAKGSYRNFVAETIRAFLDAGLTLYNEAILVTAVGSLPLRVGRQFTGSRKLGKCHQNALVFLKGDSKRANAACGPLDIPEPPPVATGDPAAAFGEVLP